jgi:hypothetical protein
MRLGRVFHRLPGMLVSRLVVTLSYVCCRGPVGMCGKLVELRGSLVRVLWQDGLLKSSGIG